MSVGKEIGAYANSAGLRKKYLVVLIVAFLSSILSTPTYFPAHPDFQFPYFLFLLSFIDGIVIIHLIDLVYSQFERRVFSKKVEVKKILFFIVTTLGVVSLYYPAYYFLANRILGFTSELYSFILSLLGSLLIVALFIVLFYGRKFIRLLTAKSISGNLKVKSGKTLHLVPIDQIKYFYSENKTVFLVRNNGKKIITNFTLNELEGLLDKRIFFRANRQFLVHGEAVRVVSSSKNDKLTVTVEANSELKLNIMVSRYKATAFKGWLENQLDSQPLS